MVSLMVAAGLSKRALTGSGNYIEIAILLTLVVDAIQEVIRIF